MKRRRPETWRQADDSAARPNKQLRRALSDLNGLILSPAARQHGGSFESLGAWLCDDGNYAGKELFCSFFDVEELVRLRRVCRAWRGLFRHARNIKLSTGKEAFLQRFVGFLRRGELTYSLSNPFLDTLSSTALALSTPVPTVRSRLLPDVREVDLSGLRLRTSALGPLLMFLGDKLEVLRLAFNDRLTDGFFQLWQACAVKKTMLTQKPSLARNLKVLDLRGCRSIYGKGLGNRLQAKPHGSTEGGPSGLPSLERIDLSFTMVSLEALRSIHRNLGPNSKVELAFSGTPAVVTMMLERAAMIHRRDREPGAPSDVRRSDRIIGGFDSFKPCGEKSSSFADVQDDVVVCGKGDPDGWIKKELVHRFLEALKSRDAAVVQACLCEAKGEWLYAPAGREETDKQEDLGISVYDLLLEGPHTVFYMSSLMLSSHFGDVEVAKILLTFGADVHATDVQGLTPLHYAAQSGSVELIDSIVQAGGDLRRLCNRGISVLSTAASAGEVEVVKYLVNRMPKKGAERLDVQDDQGATALHFAAQGGHTDVVRVLLETGASCPNVQTYGRKKAPIHLAAFRGFVETVKALIEHGADVNVPDVHGNTALHIAAQAGKVDLFDTLVRSGGDVFVQNKESVSVLATACNFGMTDIVTYVLALASGKTSLLLLECGMEMEIECPVVPSPLDEKDKSEEVVAHLSAADASGYTPLHRAANGGHKAICAQLIELGKNEVNALTNEGKGPLHLAAYRGHLGVVQLLVSLKCDVDLRSSKGRTALYYSARAGHASVTDALLAAGASPDGGMHPEDHSNPLERACRRGYAAIVRSLLRYGAKATSRAFQDAIEAGNVQIAQQLLHVPGIDANGLLPNQLRPLHLAATRGHVYIARILLALGAQPGMLDGNGQSAMHYARINENAQMIEDFNAFLDNGGPPRVFSESSILYSEVEEDMVTATLEGEFEK